MLRETVRTKNPLVPVIETVYVPACTEDEFTVRVAKPVPDGLNERVVTLRRRNRVLEEAVVARLTTPTNLLRLVTETVIATDVP